MITLYLMGSKAEVVAALKLLNSTQVNHFDKEGANLSRMRWLMNLVRHYAEQRGVWKQNNTSNYWNGETVTKLWAGVWEDLRPHLLNVTKHDNRPSSFHKSRWASLSWRTCHDKLNKKGVFKGLGI